MDAQNLHDPNAAQPLTDFQVIQGQAPETPKAPVSEAQKYFKGDTEQLAKAYGELQAKFSGDLGQLKHVVTGYDQKFNSLEKMIQDLGQKFQPQSPTTPSQAPPQGQEAEDWFIKDEETYDGKALTNALKRAIPKMVGAPSTDEIKTLASTVTQLSESLSPENLVKLIQTTVEEQQAKVSLEIEKKQLLAGGYGEDLVNLAGVTAYQNGKSSYLEGLEILRQKFPAMFSEKKDVSQMSRIASTTLPVEMSGQVPEANGLSALHKQFQNVVDFKNPSSVLMNLANRR